MSRNYQERPDLYPWVGEMQRRIENPNCPIHKEDDKDGDDEFQCKLDDAMITIDSRPLDREPQSATDSTGGEKPQNSDGPSAATEDPRRTTTNDSHVQLPRRPA